MKKVLFFIVFFCIIISKVFSVFAGEVKVTEKYMEDSGSYRYYLEDDYYIESSDKLGAVISNIVKITYNDYVTVMLYKDGEPVEISSGDYIFGDGEYTIIIKKDDKVGRINFIFDIIASENINIEDSFYNEVELVQTYDVKNQLYKQDMNGQYSISTSVPDCAITDKNVRVFAPESERAYITVTKDGKEEVFANGKTYSEPGWYSINIVYDSNYTNDYYYNGDYTTDDIIEEELNKYTEEQLESEFEKAEAESLSEPIMTAVADVAEFKFQIIKAPQNKLNFINPPKDYKINEVKFNGKPISLENNNNFKAKEDGNYFINFRSEKGFPDYTMEYVRDTKAPRLKFEGINSEGNAKKHFEITSGYEDAIINVRNNGIPVEMVGNTFDNDGLYVIEAVDEAGNENTYMINLRVPVEINLFVVIIVILVNLGFIIVYIVYTKNNIKIR